MSKEEISRKKRVKGGHRTSVKRLISMADEYPKIPVSTLQEKEVILRDINNDLLALVNEDEIEDEIGQADEYSELIRTSIANIKMSIAKLTISTQNTQQTQHNHHDTSQVHTTYDNHSNSRSNSPAAETNRPRSRTTSHLKLPKLTMKEFDGKLDQWTILVETVKPRLAIGVVVDITYNTQSWNGNQQYPYSNQHIQQAHNRLNQESQNNNQLSGDNQNYQSAQNKLSQDPSKNGATVLFFIHNNHFYDTILIKKAIRCSVGRLCCLEQLSTNPTHIISRIESISIFSFDD
ncbi:hypothetical protein LOTGIDRAFT_164094 [Lottia gigantea]|uniref:Uncharacterized protein n=1 Tax=Lottia gigantea TaxID=225164 RepID=V4BNQ2_LOTGI|nr:hypothetical protein LOTGIDRAFT_164094 [Lottia gigantea]ESO90509.1 hypothetical protein LOTGIDRAFT_164094 [Lottia gigantea]